MIFSTTVENFYNEESYKERNLYYKIFAGYLFNELIEGEEERKNSFIYLLKNNLTSGEKKSIGNGISEMLTEMVKEKFQVTFDYHSCQVIDKDKQEDRGEMSDILLVSENYFISIECKYLSDLHYHKDIVEVHTRISKVNSDIFTDKTPLQVLLIKEEKWGNIKKEGEKSNGNSFIEMFQQYHSSKNSDEYKIPIVVLLWEEILPIIKDVRVSDYLIKQLERKK